jgi:hypothetical protein
LKLPLADTCSNADAGNASLITGPSSVPQRG